LRWENPGREQCFEQCCLSTRNDRILPDVGRYDWDESYTFDALLPYFQKSVNSTPRNATLRPQNSSVPPVSDNSFSPCGGPLKVSYIMRQHLIAGSRRRLKKLASLKRSKILSVAISSGSQYTPHQPDPSDETRSSSQASFLNAALSSNRANLQIYPNTLANRIIFFPNKTATVVQVNITGNTPYLRR
jgi:choline dehydrogenase